jgi:hypothetical protein
MKTLSSRLFITILTAGAILAALPALADPQTSVPVPIAVNMLSVSNATANASATNVYYTPQTGVYTTNGDYSVPVTQNAQLIIQPMLQAANTGTSNYISFWDLDVIGSGDTAFSTTYPIIITNVLNGTNLVVGYTVINWTNVTGAVRLRLDQVSTTQTNAVSLSAKIGSKTVAPY